jgi:hypothetical protein
VKLDGTETMNDVFHKIVKALVGGGVDEGVLKGIPFVKALLCHTTEWNDLSFVCTLLCVGLGRAFIVKSFLEAEKKNGKAGVIFLDVIGKKPNPDFGGLLAKVGKSLASDARCCSCCVDVSLKKLAAELNREFSLLLFFFCQNHQLV